MESDDVAKARKKVEDEFSQFRERLGPVYVAMDAVTSAGPMDDIHDLLEQLEDATKEARTGGLVGSGAKGHRRALKKLREAESDDAV